MWAIVCWNLVHEHWAEAYGDVLDKYPLLKEYQKRGMEELKEHVSQTPKDPISHWIRSKIDL